MSGAFVLAMSLAGPSGESERVRFLAELRFGEWRLSLWPIRPVGPFRAKGFFNVLRVWSPDGDPLW